MIREVSDQEEKCLALGRQLTDNFTTAAMHILFQEFINLVAIDKPTALQVANAFIELRKLDAQCVALAISSNASGHRIMVEKWRKQSELLNLLASRYAANLSNNIAGE